MYMFKQDVDIKINKSAVGRAIGLTQPTMSKILNRKVACRKVVAYCITKYLDQDAEIEDYFELIKKGD